MIITTRRLDIIWYSCYHGSIKQKNKRKVKLIIMRKAPMTDKVETAGSSPVWANNENKELENRVIKLSKQ